MTFLWLLHAGQLTLLELNSHCSGGFQCSLAAPFVMFWRSGKPCRFQAGSPRMLYTLIGSLRFPLRCCSKALALMCLPFPETIVSVIALAISGVATGRALMLWIFCWAPSGASLLAGALDALNKNRSISFIPLSATYNVSCLNTCSLFLRLLLGLTSFLAFSLILHSTFQRSQKQQASRAM